MSHQLASGSGADSRYRPGTRHFATVSLILVLGSLSLAGRAEVYTIGIEPDCTHGNIQNAINDLPTIGSHEIRLRAGGIYFEQELQIQSREIAIVGGFENCSSPLPTGPNSILEGEGTDPYSGHVIEITGTGNFVTLHNLTVRKGNAVESGSRRFGGGILFNGGGVLGLTNTLVVNNHAFYGGGINVSAVGGSATLYLNAGTLVFGNTADFDGGGIRLWGDEDHPAELFMYSPETSIMGNWARIGFGGGIALINNAKANIGSPGFGGAGAIYDNTARHGGGIAGLNENGGVASPGLVLFTTDPARPVRVHGNHASERGGGIAWFPWAGLGACLFDFRIDGNQAPDGSALFVESVDIHAQVWANIATSEPYLCPFPAALGASHCVPGPECNVIEGNIAADDEDQPTDGATVHLGNDAQFNARTVQFRDNVAGNLLRVLGEDNLDAPSIILRNGLLAGNTTRRRLIQAEFGSRVDIIDSTIGGNNIGHNEVMAVDGDFELHRSILYQPGKTSLAPGGGARTIEYVLTSERLSLDGGNGLTVAEGDARFWDPGQGDYHLHAASDAVDFAPAGVGGADLDGQPREIDLALKPDRNGPRDLGVYERQELLPLVRNGSFGLDLRHWELPPGTSTWVEEGVDPGAVLVSEVSPADAIVTGPIQCIPVPGPGTYALNAHAMAPGFGINRDYPVLRWSYRADSANCSGAPTSHGELNLPRSGSFATASIPAIVESTEDEWTHDATLAVRLAVRDGDAVGTNAVRAHFDLVRLEPVVDDVIFAGGFDP